MTSEKADNIFFKELKECSKRIYDIPKFIYYAIDMFHNTTKNINMGG
jgi:hypothetical protein